VVEQGKDGSNLRIFGAVQVSLSPQAFAQRLLGFPCWLVDLQLRQGECLHLSGRSGPDSDVSLLADANQELCLQNIACQLTRTEEAVDRPSCFQ